MVLLRDVAMTQEAGPYIVPETCQKAADAFINQWQGNTSVYVVKAYCRKEKR